MFCISKDKEFSKEIISKMLNNFNLNILPKLEKRKNYYDGKQAILQKSYSDATKPCAQIVTNFCKNIVDNYNGYIATPGHITYKAEDEVLEILKANDYQHEDSQLLRDALIYGVGTELMYINAKGETAFANIDPRQCFGVFADDLTSELLYFVRFYQEDQWEVASANNYIVEVFDKTSQTIYKMNGQDGALEFIESKPHYFKTCPANIFYLSDEASIFDCIVDLQDGYNELVSSEIDDYSAFCDAYLTLIGCDLEPEDVAAMKANRVLVLPDDASASWLTKNANDAQVENLLKRLQENIYRVAQCPDFNSDTFAAGVTSGIALRIKLSGIETRAGSIEAAMKKALLNRIRIIGTVITATTGEDNNVENDVVFTRNVPIDESTTAQMINTLRGLVSDETLLAQLPFVSDPKAEVEAVKASQTANIYPDWSRE